MSVQRQDVHAHLVRVLAEEGRLLGEFEGVLEQETGILRGEDADAIARIGDDRHRYVDSLTRLDAERMSTCRMLSFGTGPHAMARLLEWADPSGALRHRWSQNLDIARRCKAVNDRNGAIVSAKLGRVQQLLGKLRGSSTPAIYSARGGRYGALGSRNLGCA
jgi:flagellar biosynthesis/type III secretory pathway chaperone